MGDSLSVLARAGYLRGCLRHGTDVYLIAFARLRVLHVLSVIMTGVCCAALVLRRRIWHCVGLTWRTHARRLFFVVACRVQIPCGVDEERRQLFFYSTQQHSIIVMKAVTNCKHNRYFDFALEESSD